MPVSSRLIAQFLFIVLLPSCSEASTRARFLSPPGTNGFYSQAAEHEIHNRFPCFMKDGRRACTDGDATHKPHVALQVHPTTKDTDISMPEAPEFVTRTLSEDDLYDHQFDSEYGSAPSGAAHNSDNVEVASDSLLSWMKLTHPYNTHKLKIKAGKDIEVKIPDEKQVLAVVVPLMLVKEGAANKDGSGCIQSGGKVWADAGSEDWNGLVMQPHTSEKDWKACQKKCSKVTGCAHFTYWHVGSGTCTLQTKDAMLRDAPHNPGMQLNNTFGPPKCEESQAATKKKKV